MPTSRRRNAILRPSWRSRIHFWLWFWLAAISIPVLAAPMPVLASAPETGAPAPAGLVPSEAVSRLGAVGTVGLGGALGAMGRYGVESWLGAGFPYGTLTVNVIGSLGLGLVTGWAAQTGALAAPWGQFLITGVLGGFTTFSTFANDTLILLRGGDWLSASGYVAGSLALSLGALVLGQTLMVLWLP